MNNNKTEQQWRKLPKAGGEGVRNEAGAIGNRDSAETGHKLTSSQAARFQGWSCTDLRFQQNTPIALQ